MHIDRHTSEKLNGSEQTNTDRLLQDSSHLDERKISFKCGLAAKPCVLTVSFVGLVSCRIGIALFRLIQMAVHQRQIMRLVQ